MQWRAPGSPQVRSMGSLPAFCPGKGKVDLKTLRPGPGEGAGGTGRVELELVCTGQQARADC